VIHADSTAPAPTTEEAEVNGRVARLLRWAYPNHRRIQRQAKRHYTALTRAQKRSACRQLEHMAALRAKLRGVGKGQRTVLVSSIQTAPSETHWLAKAGDKLLRSAKWKHPGHPVPNEDR
jgi:hypothetical protein